jgi:hypothetical protein
MTGPAQSAADFDSVPAMRVFPDLRYASTTRILGYQQASERYN